MSRTILLTLGRLPKGLDLARSFAQAGWRVVVADPFPRHVLGASRAVSRAFQVTAPAQDAARFREDLLDIVAAQDVSLIAPVSEEILHVAPLRERLPSFVQVFAMPQADLLAVHDKARFAAFARELGLPAPETAAAEDAAAQEIAASGPFIVKPRHACAGLGVRRHEAGALWRREPGSLVQRLIVGEERSVCALAHGGRVTGCVVYRGAMMSGTVAVRFERMEDPAIAGWVEAFAQATGWSGFLSFDFIVDAAGTPHAIECNPRLTSGVHFFETPDIARAMLDPSAPLRFRRETLLQQFWPCLSQTQASFGDWPAFARNMRALFGARDVTWSPRDPWPLVGQPWSAWPIIARARAQRCSFGEAASADLLWRGEAGLTRAPGLRAEAQAQGGFEHARSS
jgi:predicted ATP-grasp superfamily ATP-dependent carboligase